VQLANGNIVVSNPGDSSRFFKNGAVHLYSQFSATPIASIYGNAGGDLLGSSGITALGNNNYVIASTFDNVNGLVDAGSVRLMDGNTGTQIGAALAGDVGNDRLGSSGITVLGNNNYVIASSSDDENGLVDAGSVRLVNGSTGAQIGAALAGDMGNDRLGISGITALGNNHYVIASSSDDENGLVDAGSVRLVNGSTGAQIGAALAGDMGNDRLGISGITALGNNHYVIASSSDDENGLVDAGSVRLVDGNTGVQIGVALAGDVADDALGVSRITALGNNNYVIASALDDENGIVDAGSVRLVDGNTGAQIGAALAGDGAGDLLGGSGITALGNNNYVIISVFDNENGIVDAGSVRLVNGSTGVQVGATFAGDEVNDRFGVSGVTALGNNNYVIASGADAVNGIANAGSVRLVDGNTGVQVGAMLAGDGALDSLGISGITALGNNNYVIASEVDDVNGVVDAGSVRLVDGSTGVQIGVTMAGDTTNDFFGSSGITVLANNNYVIATSFDNENGIVDAGSVRLVDGNTGAQIGATLAGDGAGDLLGGSGITALANNQYVIASSFDDENGIVDAGSVRLVDGSTGAQIGAAIVGAVSDDMLSVQVIKPVSGDYYILSQPNADNGEQVDAGVVRIVVP
jgi:hypothetical protein